jgi:hypothetical protein
MTAFLLFLAAVAAFMVAAFRKVAGQTARLDAAEKKAAEADAAVQAAKAEVGNVEKATALVHAEVEKRLADLDKHIAEERARDTVDVANDIIGRN